MILLINSIDSASDANSLSKWFHSCTIYEPDASIAMANVEGALLTVLHES
jgi:hypothetical protein